MKKCITCKEEKQHTEFHKASSTEDGLRNQCKVCRVSWSHSKIGRISLMYRKQVSNSKCRNHSPPSYTKGQLVHWCLCQNVFHELFHEWELSNFSKGCTPTCDRLDDSKPYTFCNIQLMTWQSNKEKGEYERKNGISVTNQMRAVLQISIKRRKVLTKYASVALAARAVGSCTTNISACCNGCRTTASGYRWEYK